MTLHLYDTARRAKVAFEPLVPGEVSMYVCGPTVYDDPHLGHARAAIAFDVIRRVLEASGHRVRFVQNITDVDDKIITRAGETGDLPEELAERYSRSYEDQMRRIGVRAPTLTPKATQHLADMQTLIERLITAGSAYPVDGGDVYFAVDAYAGYGTVSGRSLDEMRAGERVEVDPRKRHPMDFALWKGARNGEISWPAPWGAGRPGWHIECSAMSMRYLGETFDIHGGGSDLIFPHHENEAAQSTAVTGKPLARYWLHNGMVTVGDEKMGKSLNNFRLLGDLLDAHPVPAVRLLFATSHYRSQIEVNDDALRDAAAVWDRLATFARNAVRALGGVAPEPVPSGESYEAFIASLHDDVNSPGAMAVLHELITAGNVAIEEVERGGDASMLTTLVAQFRAATEILGLDPLGDWQTDDTERRIAPLVELLLEQRRDARAAKDFASADRIRDTLIAAGVVVEDRPDGARWHVADTWT